MNWKPIVAGVDPSPEGARAAHVAEQLAQAAGTDCYLVHAVRDPWTEASLAQIPMDIAELNRMVLDGAETRMRQALAGRISARTLDRLAIRFGPAPMMLDEALDERDAELLVLGGKHHSAIGRWLGGSTVHHAVRRVGVPLFVTGPSEGPVRRILAAVDLSTAARPTIAAAERFAELFDAELRAIHVVEPTPVFGELPPSLTEDEVERRSEEDLERSVWPLLTRPGTDHLIRRGPGADTLAAAATEWGADLLVVGSHGRGWVDRALIGSVTERLLNRLPAAMLVVPVSAPARKSPARTPARAPATRPRASKARR